MTIESGSVALDVANKVFSFITSKKNTNLQGGGWISLQAIKGHSNNSFDIDYFCELKNTHTGVKQFFKNFKVIDS